MKKNIILIVMMFFSGTILKAQTVTIGTQVWTSKNLDVDKFRNGDPIPQAQTAEEWKKAGENKQPAWCYYDNDPINGRKYGKLYNWYAVYDQRGLAPAGFHIPTTFEWEDLVDFLGSDAGYKMKSITGWYDNGNGNNSSGFSALPGGIRLDDGQFHYMGEFGQWWSAPEGSTYLAWYRYLSYGAGNLYRQYNDSYREGLSVRCLKD
jgi:uncharacterized protein (TIGR02145 family)